MNYNHDNGWGRSGSIKICGGLWLRKYQVLSTLQIIVGVILVWTWQFWSHPLTMASVIFIFHLKIIEVVNSCCCLVRILYFYSSYKVLEKFKDRWVRREGFGEWYDGGELIHLLYLLSIEQPRTWTSLELFWNCIWKSRSTQFYFWADGFHISLIQFALLSV